MRHSRINLAVAAAWVAGFVAVLMHGAPAPAQAAGPQWTIYCAAFSGPDHVRIARQTKDQLMRETALRDWYIIHNKDESVLYHGYYVAIADEVDAGEAAKAQADRAAISALTDLSGNRPYRLALFVELSNPDPHSPPEWNLVNARGDITLQVGVYKEHPDRKKAAVEAVREARAQGVEAYYYHGPTASSVCVGAWPASALTVTEEGTDARPVSPTELLVVLPYALPPGVAPQAVAPDGTRMRALTPPTVTVVEPSLREAMARFPVHAINGEMIVKTGRNAQGQVVQKPSESVLVQIPREPTPAVASEAAPPAPEPVPTLLTPKPSTPGKGKLKSIE